MTAPKETQFTPDGRLILNPMLGPWDRYEPGSEQWAQAIAMHIQLDYRQLKQEGRVGYLVRTLRTAVESDPAPWVVFPPEAKKSPEAWIRMVTGESWSDVKAAVQPRDPAAWLAIADRLAKWEKGHRKPGAPKGNQNAAKEKARTTASDTRGCRDRDSTEARGIQRRLAKRADAGDAQAAELVEQIAAGDLTVNQAAIAAGMRQRYFRVPLTDDVNKLAASIRRHLSPDHINALAQALTR
jgi:hypothetical protein